MTEAALSRLVTLEVDPSSHRANPRPINANFCPSGGRQATGSVSPTTHWAARLFHSLPTAPLCSLRFAPLDADLTRARRQH